MQDKRTQEVKKWKCWTMTGGNKSLSFFSINYTIVCKQITNSIEVPIEYSNVCQCHVYHLLSPHPFNYHIHSKLNNKQNQQSNQNVHMLSLWTYHCHQQPFAYSFLRRLWRTSTSGLCSRLRSKMCFMLRLLLIFNYLITSLVWGDMTVMRK